MSKFKEGQEVLVATCLGEVEAKIYSVRDGRKIIVTFPNGLFRGGSLYSTYRVPTEAVRPKPFEIHEGDLVYGFSLHSGRRYVGVYEDGGLYDDQFGHCTVDKIRLLCRKEDIVNFPGKED